MSTNSVFYGTKLQKKINSFDIWTLLCRRLGELVSTKKLQQLLRTAQNKSPSLHICTYVQFVSDMLNNSPIWPCQRNKIAMKRRGQRADRPYQCLCPLNGPRNVLYGACLCAEHAYVIIYGRM